MIYQSAPVSKASRLNGEPVAAHLLVRRDERADVVAFAVVVDKLDVPDQGFAVRLGLLEAVLHAQVLLDRLLLAVDVLERVDETAKSERE